MRALKYYVACSVDGFIAHRDGSFDGFLADGEHVADFLASYDWFDVVLMGRKTYEVGLREGKTNPYPMLKSYVFSRTMKASPDPHLTLVSENAIDLVKGLRGQSGKDVWLCGGAELAFTLFGAGLVDELVIKLNPLLLGAGIPLFAGVVRQSALELAASKVYGNGVALLRYRVPR
jgi:dihydrofolate reductase